MSREDAIQEVCKQVQEVFPDVNQNNWYASCPFCANGKYGADILAEIEHDENCAFIIAKELMKDE